MVRKKQVREPGENNCSNTFYLAENTENILFQHVISMKSY